MNVFENRPKSHLPIVGLLLTWEFLTELSKIAQSGHTEYYFLYCTQNLVVFVCFFQKSTFWPYFVSRWYSLKIPSSNETQFSFLFLFFPRSGDIQMTAQNVKPVWPYSKIILVNIWPFATMKVCVIVLVENSSFFRILIKHSKSCQRRLKFTRLAKFCLIWFTLNKLFAF